MEAGVLVVAKSSGIAICEWCREKGSSNLARFQGRKRDLEL
jgi:hypothetical protein